MRLLVPFLFCAIPVACDQSSDETGPLLMANMSYLGYDDSGLAAYGPPPSLEQTGEVVLFYPNGNKCYHGHMTLGFPTGECRGWDQQGNLMYSAKYATNPAIPDEYIAYDSLGNVATEKLLMEDGVYRERIFLDGKVRFEYLYRGLEVLSGIAFDESGLILAQCSFLMGFPHDGTWLDATEDNSEVVVREYAHGERK